jgi:3-oxoacyl-[acyl-carrier-protein] synthase II
VSTSGTAIVAFGAVSALGEGWRAASTGEVGAPAQVAIARDAELEACGLARPFVARVALAARERDGAEDDGSDLLADRATRILVKSLRACIASLDATRPGWRGARVGLALGTSSGGMRTAQTLFARVARGESLSPALAARSAYFGPMLDAVAEIDLAFAPASLVLCACASSVIAIGLASRWLASDECDLVLAGGFDAVSPFVASGFEALQATSTRVPPRPFRLGRDGMALGEGGAVLALVRQEDARDAIAYLRGFGAAADAVHLTAPDRTGSGLARAAEAAIAEAGAPRIDLVSAHATATPFNDAAESRAIARVTGDAGDAIVHAFKAQIGHTLGAAGALESLAAIDALTRGIFPATAGDGARDPDAPARILDRGESGAPRVALKLASAFGGANAALVLAREPSSRARREPHQAWITRAVHVSAAPDLAALAEAVGLPLDKITRADAHVTWSLAALAALAALIGRDAFAGAGIVVGTAAATLETNARFASRLRERGARLVEPRRFPYTSPNAVAGECGVAFGLTGAAFSVGAGLHAAVEALAAAYALVRAGDASQMLVVGVDDVEAVAGAWSSAFGASLVPGAVALLVTRERIGASRARIVSARTSMGPTSASIPTPNAPAGHLALVPLAAPTPPSHVSASSTLLGTHASATLTLSPN